MNVLAEREIVEYIALRRLTVNGEFRWPGDPVPEAAEWPERVLKNEIEQGRLERRLVVERLVAAEAAVTRTENPTGAAAQVTTSEPVTASSASLTPEIVETLAAGTENLMGAISAEAERRALQRVRARK